MKKLVFLVVCVALVSLVSADFEKVREAHLNAMKYYGLTTQRDGKLFYAPVGGKMASMYIGDKVSTGYVEKEGKKIYWEVTPVEGGFKICIKVNIFGKTFEKCFVVKVAKDNVSIKAVGGDDRYDWMCLLQCVGPKVFECISCGLDWKCWGTCAGPGVVNCVMGCF